MDETLLHRVDENDFNQEADIYVDIPTEDYSKILNVNFYL